jgi:MutS domain V
VNVHLIDRDRDFDLDLELPANSDTLIADLGLETLLTEMAQGDPYLYKVAQTALLAGTADTGSILYRQGILRDCLEHPNLARELYDLTVEALEAEKSIRFGFIGFSNQYPDSTLYRAVEMLKVYAQRLQRLRKFADEHLDAFASEGLRRFFAMLQRELDDEYLGDARGHLDELGGHGGVTVSAQLGEGANPTGYRLHRRRRRGLGERIASLATRTEHVFRVPDRDEQGARMLAEMHGRAINETANAAAQAAEHIRGFFRLLRCELALYIAALNLHERLRDVGQATCFPRSLQTAQRSGAIARGLYEPCLALRTQRPVVGNDLDGERRPLLVVTGANQGGKSTFLRSLGIAQLMMQCGLFVAAEAFTANVCEAVFTHFRRGEDASMESGKLDEELARMSEIADAAEPSSLVLCNESFAATNEQEGSQIAQQVITALIDSGMAVAVVTHMYELASRLWREQAERAIFLRAERRSDGTRSFRLLVAEPLPTSYGRDVFERVFGSVRRTPPVRGR